MKLIEKIELINKVFKDNELDSQTYKNACLEVLNKALETINYTRCSEKLKDKEIMTFKKWREDNGFYYLNEHSFQNINGVSVENSEVIKMYVKYKNL